MADSILRLKVESQEYDQKIKRATDELQRYAEGCRKVGGTLEHVDEGVEEFVKALGQMQTVSKSAKGSVSELTKSFTELSVMYNKLTEEEKQGTFGKALAQSLETLKGRIQEGNVELKNIGNSLNDTGGFLNTLKDKFTINIDALKLFNAGVTAAKAALDVAKDAFFASEANVDEWGRTIDASKSLYEGFLTALNTGDISGYLSRIDSIVQAARQAYDELDRLGTMKTIQAPRMSAQQTENERMRMMIQTGRYIAPVDGRKASMQNGQLLTKEQIQRIEQQLQNGMKEVVSLVGNEVKQTGKAIDAVYNRQAQELGMSLKEFRKGTSSMAEFDKRIEGYNQYQKWRSEHTTIDMQSGRETVARGNPFEQFAKWGVFRVDGDRYNDLVRLIQQRDQQASQAYSMQSQAFRTMNRAEGMTVSKIMNGGATGGGGGGTAKAVNTTTAPTYAIDSIAAQQALVSELTKQWNEAGAEVRNSYIQPLVEAEAKLKTMKDQQALLKEQAQGRLLEDKAIEIPITANVSDSIVQSIDDIREKLKSNPIVIPIESSTKDVKALQDTARTTAKVVGTIGQAFNAIEDPAAKVASVVAQAIANVALAYSDALAKTTAEKFNIWSFIAAAAASTVSMVSTIASIHSATGYADGGMIKGNSYSGDNLMAMGPSGLIGLNAGEIVLNQAQQANVASGLRGGAMGGMSLKTKVKGTELLVWLDNSLAQSGRGELVTWGT